MFSNIPICRITSSGQAPAGVKDNLIVVDVTLQVRTNNIGRRRMPISISTDSLYRTNKIKL